MCAIAGIVGMITNDKIKADMLETMRRRGPDAEGVFQEDACCMLHTRLAVIDPAGGKQPMCYDDGQEAFTIVYNGELYNTEQIRQELANLGHKFSGHSDTEVVLHAYSQWKEGALDRFNGIFAFAVWHSREKKLFLARDRIGVKPLFYVSTPNGFVFSSEIKTLLKHPEIQPRIDHVGAAQLLLLGPGRIPGSGVFRDIAELEPGCCGTLMEGKWQWRRYWKLMDREHTDNFAETAAYVRHLVVDSIQRQMISDVSIGTFLSGGLDSSLISAVCAGVCSETGESLKTFSVDYENNSQYFVPGKFQPNADDRYIQIMAKHLQSDHHTTVLTPEDLVSCMKEATIARDLPGMADVDFSLLAFCKNIREEVTVALSGECADEIFGGYPWYRDPEIRQAEGFPWAQNTRNRASFLIPDHLRNLDATEFVMDHYRTTINDSDILPGTSRLERRMKEMVNLNFRWFMQTLLDRKDRMSMYHSLEVRVPFCDYRIAEYLYAVPWVFKDYNGREKGLLRYAMDGYLPTEVLHRKKSPYPKTHDPKYLTLVSEALRCVLNDPQSPLLQLVRKDSLENLLNAEFEWPWYGQLMRVPQTIAYMLQINCWMEQYHVEIV